jgi:ABC-type branched-subunit amino acid transport system ATPase component
MSSNPPLEVQDLSCFYGKKCAVDRASLAVREDEVVALIGANAADSGEGNRSFRSDVDQD